MSIVYASPRILRMEEKKMMMIMIRKRKRREKLVLQLLVLLIPLFALFFLGSNKKEGDLWLSRIPTSSSRKWNTTTSNKPVTLYSPLPPPPAPPKPQFQTRSTLVDLLETIDLCIDINKSRPGWCHIVHIWVDPSSGATTPHISLDSATSTPAPRIDYIIRHLKSLPLKPLKNMTLVFYTYDVVLPEFQGLPIITHSTNSHTNHLLFPTPYLLRDLQSGHLQEVLQECYTSNSTTEDDWKERKEIVYFRGQYRINPLRLQVARYAPRHNNNRKHNHNLQSNNTTNTAIGMDIGLTKLPKEETQLKVAAPSSWFEKKNYQYLLTLPGQRGGSCQWELYHDAIAGGVLVRYSRDKYEHWTYNLMKSNSSSGSSGSWVVEFDTPEEIIPAISAPNVQANKYQMATITKQYACQHLQPHAIKQYSLEFLKEYETKFGNMIDLSSSTTTTTTTTTHYLKKSGIIWKPSFYDTTTDTGTAKTEA